MKIFSLVKKDLKILKRDQKTLVLIILTPILLLFIIGNIFSSNANAGDITGVKVGICNLDNTNKIDTS